MDALSQLTPLQAIGVIVALYVVGFLVAVLRRKLRSPEKSFFNCFINVALNPVRFFRIGPFKAGKISLETSMRYAMKKGKLTDFGGADFIETYNKIMKSESFKKERFHNVGYISANIEISMTLARRLTFVQYLKDNAEVLKIPVRSPTFVMGLPRTGTTFMHRLLSLDPAARAPLTWELLNPVPRVSGASDLEAHKKDRLKRRDHIHKIIEQRKTMGDDSLAHIHEVEADLPEECLLGLTDHLPCLPMLLYDDYMNVDEFLTVDPTAAYETYRKYLQLLSYQTNDATNPKRWMLKCPIHLFYPKTLAKVFPDCKLIWNHRHPVSAVPSLCSLLTAFHKIYYEVDCLDKYTLGKKIKYVSERLLKQATVDIKEAGVPCANIVYNDLIKNPTKIVKDIYKQFGWEYTEEYDKILQEYMRKNNEEREAMKKKNAGKSGGTLHTYSPEEYSLNAEELCTGGFKEYCDLYNVPMSKG